MAGLISFLCLACQTSNCVIHREVRMNSAAGAACEICGISDKLFRCSRCKLSFYCSQEHQKLDWKKHKAECKKVLKEKNVPSDIRNFRDNTTDEVSFQELNVSNNTIVFEGSAETEILSSNAEVLTSYDFKPDRPNPEPSENSSNDVTCANTSVNNTQTIMPMPGEGVLPANRHAFKEYPEISLNGEYSSGLPPFLHNKNNFGVENENTEALEEICKSVIRDMNTYGLCVLDNFLGSDRGYKVLHEVLDMYSAGVFKDGQLVNSARRSDLKTIRGDQITWIDGKEPKCTHIGQLISQVDNIVMRANKMVNNGKLGSYTINGRTKAMVACYPGSGSHYVKHVDNPNKDGRCITAIYYLNRDWDVAKNGGLLRIFPEGWRDQVADIEPVFDRVLFFWSDRRNPHEVQPAYATRYAITLWYFDTIERDEACRRFRLENQNRALQGAHALQ